MTTPKERPILMSAPMVRAILAGSKSQTRRTVKPPAGYRCPDAMKHWTDVNFEDGRPVWLVRGDAGAFKWIPCPYGQPGDRLWVRETCRAHELTDDEARNDTYKVMEHLGLESPLFGLDGVIYVADGAFRKIENSIEAAEKWGDLHNYGGNKGATVPSIHMPRWASRITLEITGVRVERLQDISEADAQAEGVQCDTDGWFDYLMPQSQSCVNARDSYATLWDRINGPGSWDANPFVWVVEFRRIAC